MNGYIYILTNAKHTVLYTGVTRDLQRRIAEHKASQGSIFTKKYNIHKLIYVEKYDLLIDAIAREKQIKGGSRKKKELLIEEFNPDWKELNPFDYE